MGEDIISFRNLDAFFESKGYNIDEYNLMLPHINLWQSWYNGEVKKFHKYNIYNGKKTIPCNRYSLGMAKTIAETYSDLLLNEKVQYNIGKEETDNIIKEKILFVNDWEDIANEGIEKTFAFGTGAFVGSLSNMEYDIENDVLDTTNSEMKIEFVTADKIIPLKFQGKKVIDCAFITEKTIEKKIIICISIHRLDDTYKIENYFFVKEKSKLSMVTAIENSVDLYDTGSDKAWFWILRPRITNNICYNSPFGISVFANSIDTLKAIDIAYDSLINEFILGKKRIFVNKDALDIDEFGDPKFDSNDLVYYYLNGNMYGDESNGEPRKAIAETDFNLRVDNHEQGIQLNLNLLSVKTGLGDSYWKFNGGQVRTATEVISDNSNLFRSKQKHQISLEGCLYDMLKTVCYIAKNKLGMQIEEDPEISIDFDDSIIEDTQAEFNRNMILYQQGLINKVQFFMNTNKMTKPQAEEFVRESQEGILEEPLEEE